MKNLQGAPLARVPKFHGRFKAMTRVKPSFVIFDMDDLDHPGLAGVPKERHSENLQAE